LSKIGPGLVRPVFSAGFRWNFCRRLRADHSLPPGGAKQQASAVKLTQPNECQASGRFARKHILGGAVEGPGWLYQCG
jgi:hypothetical protein